MFELTGNYIFQSQTQYYAEVEVQGYDIRKCAIHPETFTMYIQVFSDSLDKAEIEAKSIMRQLGFESPRVNNCIIRTIAVASSEMFQNGVD